VNEIPRCLTLFEESCRTEATKKTYSRLLELFLKHVNKDHESLLLLPDDQLQILLEDYMIYCKKRFMKSGIITRFSAISKFLFVNDRIVNTKKLMMFLPEAEKRKQRAITNEECQELLSHSSTNRTRAIIHLFCATGARPEALVNVRMMDIGQMPDDCQSLVLYADTKNELTTFIHSEASKAVNEYLNERKESGELLKPESYLIRPTVFIVNEKIPQPVSIHVLESVLDNSMRRAKIKRKKVDEHRYDLALCGGFRKRFNFILKRNPNISYPIAEIFMDHKMRMEAHYLTPTKEELFEEYKKAIPELMLDESAKLKEELRLEQKDIESSNDKVSKELRSNRKEIADMKERFASLEDILKKLSQKD